MNKKNFNKKKNFTKGKGHKSEPEFKTDEQSGFEKYANHPQWLAPSDDFAKGAANLYFSWPAGVQPRSFNGVTQAFAGVAQLEIDWTFGSPQNPTDAINMAAQRYYSFIRHANSGSSNYDRADLALMLMGVTSAQTYLTWLQRIYGLTDIYSTENRYYPEAIIKSMGVDYNSVRTNRADFRTGINTLIAKLNQIATPKQFHLRDRMFWAIDKLYCDTTSAKSQVYYFQPRGWHRFELDDEGVGMLQYYTEDYTQLKPYERLLEIGEEMIDALLIHEDIGIMSGDILKAYKSDIFVMPAIAENYLTPILYDKEAFTMISNATIMAVDNLPNIYQNPDVGAGYLFTNYSATIDSDHKEYMYGNRIINLGEGMSDDPYNILRGLYLSNITANSATAPIANTTAFVLIKVRIFTIDVNSTTHLLELDIDIFNATHQLSSADSIKSFARWANFDYLPGLILLDEGGSPTATVIDINNFAYVTKKDIEDAHYVTVLAEFDIGISE